MTHAKVAGQRGDDAIAAMLKEKFTWRSMTKDFRDFVANGLLCVLSRSSSYDPRVLATAFHGSRQNEVLHFGYLFRCEITAAVK